MFWFMMDDEVDGDNDMRWYEGNVNGGFLNWGLRYLRGKYEEI